MHCNRIILNKKNLDELKDWLPGIDEFDSVVNRIHNKFTTTRAAHDALDGGDKVLAHSILFMQDSLFFWEFCNAICDADVGRMWLVYDFWVYMMRGAGCHNYVMKSLKRRPSSCMSFRHCFVMWLNVPGS